jgi:hypothetical protein
MYLGEIAQHTVELAGTAAGAEGGKPARVKVAQLNPGPSLTPPGAEVSVAVTPSDVVVLPV